MQFLAPEFNVEDEVLKSRRTLDFLVYRRDVDIPSFQKQKRPGTPCVPARLD